MNTDKQSSLPDSYMEGESSLQEEKLLIESANSSDTIEKTWLSYLKEKRREAPDDLQESITKLITSKKRRHTILRVSLVSAASIAIVLSTTIVNSINRNYMSTADKKAALLEARSLFSENRNESSDREIIYEDETVIIFIK